MEKKPPSFKDLKLSYVTKAMLGVLDAGAIAKKKISDTIDKKKEANRIREENERLLNESNNVYLQSALKLAAAAEELDKIKAKINEMLSVFGQESIRTVKIETIIKLAEQSNVYTDSAIKGIAAGLAAGVSTVGLVATFGTASTGTALSSLSGVALTHATLAAMGGGSIAAGGFGMAGGAVVLGTLFAVPTLAVGTYALIKNVDNNYEEALKQQEEVKKAIEINNERVKENEKARKLIMFMYDRGIEILFFYKTLLENSIARLNDSKIKIIIAESSEQVGKRYIELLPLIRSENETKLNDETKQMLNEISNNVDYMLSVANSSQDVIEIYDSNGVIPVFEQVFNDASKFIYMTYPNYRKSVIDDLRLAEKIKNALNKGVQIIICYGLIGNKKSFAKEHNSYSKTVEAIKYLKEKIGTAKEIEFRPCDSHRKICVCEKYALEGSHNIMSYSPSERDNRCESTAKHISKHAVSKYAYLIKYQPKCLP